MRIIKENKYRDNKLTEADGAVPFKLPQSMLNNPNSIDLKGLGARAKADADAKAAEEARAKALAANKEKYKDLISRAQAEEEAEKQLEVLFEELVPSKGKADTVAGELCRAMMRILYRDFNDGDIFYEGYGIETCGGSVAYLISIIGSLFSKFEGIVQRHLIDDTYTAALGQICQEVCDYIFANDSVWQVNEEDSRGGDFDKIYEQEYREEWEYDYDYDFQIPPTVQEYIEAGYIIIEEVIDEVRNMLDGNWSIKYKSIEDSWSDYILITGLDKESYDELESWRLWDDSSWSDYIDELISEYGDLDEEDEDEDEDDIDESLETDIPAPSYKKGDVVSYMGKQTTIMDVENDSVYGVDYLIVNPNYDGTDSRYEMIWVGDAVDPV